MIRKTFSGDYDPTKHGNMNNQSWHQDSNPLLDFRPMLTLWIPLQDGCSTIRPGLELLGLRPSSFCHLLGDSASVEDIKAYYNVKGIDSFAPKDINAGDCLIFNGLTFHRTYITESMQHDRDVLLIRCCASVDASYFPGDQSSHVTFAI